MSGIVIPKEFAYPVIAVVSTFYILVWQTIRVGIARRKAKIEYPQIYAEKAEAAANKEAHKFNCTQRAHQNTLELMPIVVSGTLISGLTYPMLATAFCGVWTVARIVYTIGYSSGDVKKRDMGSAAKIGSLSHICLILLSTASAISLARSL